MSSEVNELFESNRRAAACHRPIIRQRKPGPTSRSRTPYRAKRGEAGAALGSDPREHSPALHPNVQASSPFASPGRDLTSLPQG